LIKAGYPDGFNLNFLTQKEDVEKIQLFEVYQNDLKKIGVSLNLHLQPWGGLVTTVKDRTLMSDPKNAMHIICVFLSPAPFTPWKIVDRYYASHSHLDKPFGGYNYGYYSNPKIDAYINQALSATDRKKALEIWREANAELINDCAAIPTVDKTIIVGMRDDIKGYKFRIYWQPGVCRYSELWRE